MAALACACGAAWAATDAGSDADSPKPMLFAYYYIWYGTPDGALGQWSGWGHDGPSAYAPDGVNPNHIIFPPGIRDIASCAYPLAGAYDSNDEAVVRWHVRLAKAAGIDAFLVSWWGPSEHRVSTVADRLLPIAAEEDFHIALFDETPQFWDDLDAVKKQAAEHLNRFKDHPGYLRLDGKPVYAIYQVPFAPRLTVAEARDLCAHLEARVGPVFVILDKMRNGRLPGRDAETFVIDEEWRRLEAVDAFTFYGTFSHQRLFKYDDLAYRYRDFVRLAHEAGRKALVPVHPGHNNSKLQTEPWVMPRRNGRTLREYLRMADDSGADYVAVTSFNEWPETTNVEPARTWPDPYHYLKILADWKGRTFVAPTPPACVTHPARLE